MSVCGPETLLLVSAFSDATVAARRQVCEVVLGTRVRTWPKLGVEARALPDVTDGVREAWVSGDADRIVALRLGPIQAFLPSVNAWKWLLAKAAPSAVVRSIRRGSVFPDRDSEILDSAFSMKYMGGLFHDLKNLSCKPYAKQDCQHMAEWLASTGEPLLSPFAVFAGRAKWDDYTVQGGRETVLRLADLLDVCASDIIEPQAAFQRLAYRYFEAASASRDDAFTQRFEKSILAWNKEQQDDDDTRRIGSPWLRRTDQRP